MDDDPAQAEFRFADRELLASLVALLPPVVVMVREGAQRGQGWPFTRGLACEMIERALCEGWTIDRSNGEGLVSEWDGWLLIESPKRTFLQIAQPGGGVLTGELT